MQALGYLLWIVWVVALMLGAGYTVEFLLTL